MHRDSCPLDCKVYVGNLGNNGNKTELERAFGYYGPLRSVWVARNPPGFAFVEFEDPRDVPDAVRELDVAADCEKDCGKELPSVEQFDSRRVKPLLERMLHHLKVEWALPLVMVVVEDGLLNVSWWIPFKQLHITI
ncbi:Serine/arginine-rich splicing factor 3 [Microtus ochrogaster]|uniref:Serine/arginine-rich splicing factor 3 n=1 Tax=Microtus ochrogaster TaxID=79684 RepID=A0A8J6GSN5_MICOH|nr:Serine/arginine-rich splicing factor 3 [Microtus ochrogaster]